jgi:hypothetical protein
MLDVSVLFSYRTCFVAKCDRNDYTQKLSKKILYTVYTSQVGLCMKQFLHSPLLRSRYQSKSLLFSYPACILYSQVMIGEVFCIAEMNMLITIYSCSCNLHAYGFIPKVFFISLCHIYFGTTLISYVYKFLSKF